MNMDKIGKALMLCADTLGYDHPGVIKIDEAEGDDGIKEGLKECLETLDKDGKTAVAEQVRENVKGWL